MPALGFASIDGYGQQYKNIVFEGAGARGLAYAGAIREMENRQMLQCVERVGGTSAGAITALMVSLGYSAIELEKIVHSMRLQKFNDGKFIFVGGINRLNKHYGWYRGKAFTMFLEKIIADKTGDSEITFQQLYSRGFRELYVTGTSLNRQQLIIFSRENYPAMKVKDAVRISISIPLYFEAVCIDSSGQVINCRKGKKNNAVADIMVDGGFTGNFPIFMFDSLYHAQDLRQRRANPETIGFRIDSPEQIAYDQKRKGLSPVSINGFNNYVGALYTYVIENLNRTQLTEEDWVRTVSINSGGVSPKIKKLSPEQKASLIQNGAAATRSFFDRTGGK